MVQLQNKVCRFHVLVLSCLDKDFGDENSIGDLLSFHRLIVCCFFFQKNNYCFIVMIFVVKLRKKNHLCQGWNFNI